MNCSCPDAYVIHGQAAVRGFIECWCFLLEQLLLGATSLLDLAWSGMNSELSIPEGNRVKQEHRKRYV